MPDLIEWYFKIKDKKEQKNKFSQRNEIDSVDKKNRNNTFWAITLSSLIGLGAGMYIKGCKDDISTVYNNWQNEENKTEVVDTSERSNPSKPSDTTIKKDTSDSTSKRHTTEKPDSTYKSDKDQKTDTIKIDSKRVNQLEERVSDLEEDFDSLKEKVGENTIKYNNLSDKVENIRDDLEDLDNQVASIHSYHTKKNEEIKSSLEELKENYQSLEKRLDNIEDSGGNDSKNEDKNGLERDYSRGGLSKKEDPGKQIVENTGEFYWAPLVKFYDCANEQIVEGTNNLRNNQPDKYQLKDASFVMYKGNVFENKQGAPHTPWDPISGGTPLESVIDTSENNPDRQGFYKIHLHDVKKQEICVPTRNGNECKFYQYWGKFSADN